MVTAIVPGELGFFFRAYATDNRCAQQVSPLTENQTYAASSIDTTGSRFNRKAARAAGRRARASN